MSDINDRRNPEMIVFQAVTPLQHKAALEQVREVLARRHNFNPKDDKSTPEWDTVDDSKDIQQFGLALQAACWVPNWGDWACPYWHSGGGADISRLISSESSFLTNPRRIHHKLM